jgi:transposase
MAKYDEKLKLRVVQQYLSGRYSFSELSLRRKLDQAMMRRWVACCGHHGAPGLRKKYSHYTGQFKLSVLQHMWREGLSHLQTSALFDLRRCGVVGQWERRYHESGLKGLEPKPRGRPRKMPEPPRPPKPPAVPSKDTRSREQLVEEVEYLRAEAAYLKKANALVQAKKLAALKKRG